MSSLLAADKEFAYCQVARRAYGAGRGVRAGRRRAMAGHAACRGGLDCTYSGQGRGRSAP
eukprot:scaffold7207_cov62-Phaeocystis_antarctica.AAC.3